MRITVETGPKSPDPDDHRFKMLVSAVVADAYRYLAEHNRKSFPGYWRPWSRRSAGQITLVPLGEPNVVGEDFASRVRPYLQNAGIIDPETDQINLDRYPDIGSVQRALFGKPRFQRSAPIAWLNKIKSLWPGRLVVE